MSKKIMIIHGSPRKKGNTAGLSTAVIQAAKNKGALITEIHASELEHKVPGCQSCMQCHLSKEYTCILGDQLAEKVASLVDYDVILLATPTYWMSYPAQLKIFIDRMGSLMKFTDKGELTTDMAGKHFGLLATAGGGMESNLDLLEQQWRSVANIFSCSYTSCLFPGLPVKSETMEIDDTTTKKAIEFGEHLASA